MTVARCRLALGAIQGREPRHLLRADHLEPVRRQPRRKL
eukprot:COSAG06_NODE_12650_length_1347_cov_1.873397_1_plen_38_part_01